MINIPDYIDCKNKEIEVCDYLLTDGCPSTCAYALDIGGIGVGASDQGVVNLLNRIVEEELIDSQKKPIAQHLNSSMCKK